MSKKEGILVCFVCGKIVERSQLIPYMKCECGSKIFMKPRSPIVRKVIAT